MCCSLPLLDGDKSWNKALQIPSRGGEVGNNCFFQIIHFNDVKKKKVWMQQLICAVPLWIKECKVALFQWHVFCPLGLFSFPPKSDRKAYSLHTVVNWVLFCLQCLSHTVQQQTLRSVAIRHVNDLVLSGNILSLDQQFWWWFRNEPVELNLWINFNDIYFLQYVGRNKLFWDAVFSVLNSGSNPPFVAVVCK